ncbi:hypothetical protein [Streptomyces sp. NPDC006355]|uniref:hypothetical protein n=1 Tax=Streptomyces sp. NPDC006355 TaxID=3156758 RepID=UPI0033B68DA2
MTHNVLHRGYGITINLSAPDLANPDRPGLLQEIHRNYKPDLLYCLGAHEYGTVCPGLMTIVVFPNVIVWLGWTGMNGG